VSDFNQELRASLGELADEPVENTGPTGDFVYVDISSIDRETKKIIDPKPLGLSQAPSRAKQVLKAGDVLVSMTRPNLNAVALVPENLDGAIGSTGFHVLRSRWLAPQFLLALVQTQSFIDAMSAVVQGALYPAVRPRDIAAYSFSFEVPAQQTRIVAKLEELLSDLDAGVAELKAAQKKLKQYRQSLLKSAVEGALTAEWRAQHTPTETGAQLLQRILTERRARWEAKQLAKFKEQGKAPPKDWQKKYPEPVQPDTTDLPKLPEGWVWASLDMLGEIASGVAKGTKRTADVEVREVPYLRVANVQRGFLNLSEIKTISATERDIAELTLQAGDILFNEGGDRDKLGRGWVWRDEVANCIHQNHVFRMRPYLREVLPELISHHGNTFGKMWFQNAGKQTTNLASIKMTMLRMFPVPLGPVDEQRELLTLLELQIEQIDRQEQAVELGLKQSTAQRQNILRAAFAGQLVPQDLNDEPASVLLERIRAERAEHDKQPKVRKFRKTKQQKEVAAVVSKLIDVLAEAGDWMSAKEAFRRCGVADGALTDQVETLYAELRALDKAGRLAVEAVTDEQGRKLHDRLKLLAV
jgi:type I restriction enzyme S subunit|tara:strand:- start:5681 stop:7435 length:1755 start_codon:yes stop_codon:yes gene_type:complete